MSLAFAPRGAIALLLPCVACFNPDSPSDPDTGDLSTGASSPVTESIDPDTGSPVTTTAQPLDTTAADATTGSVADTSTTSPTADSNDPTGSVDDTTADPSVCSDSPNPDAFCLAIDPVLPHCDLASDTCVACVDDLDCPVLQVCDPDTHTCSECVVDADCTAPGKPACDPDTRTCGCNEHAECPATACDLEAHTCFPAGLTAVVWSSSDMGSHCRNVDTACTEMDPCCSVADALARGISSELDHVVIRVLPGLPGVHDTVVFDPVTVGKRIAVLGWPEATLESQYGTGPLMYVNAPARVYIARLTLKALGTSQAGAGVSCFGGAGVWVDDVTVEPLTAGVGFFSAACPLQVRRSTVRQTNGGVRLTTGAIGRIVDTIIAHPGEFGVRAENAATVELIFSTVVETTGIDRRQLQCSGIGSSITARNSLLFSSPELGSNDCPVSVASNSLVTADSLGPDATIISSDEAADLFIAFETGNLHVKPGSLLLSETAIREAGDPSTDIDGDPRPLTIGALDWAGADVP